MLWEDAGSRGGSRHFSATSPVLKVIMYSQRQAALPVRVRSRGARVQTQHAARQGLPLLAADAAFDMCFVVVLSGSQSCKPSA